MARIVDYQETTTPANNDVLLIETEDGTRKVKKSVLLKAVLDLIGDTDISDIGDGTTTGAISAVNQKVTKTQAMIAQPFDANKSGGYAVGDIVTYADKLYKFTSAHSGAWTGLDVEQVDVVDVIEDDSPFPNVIRIDLESTTTWYTLLNNILTSLNSLGINDFTTIKDCKLLIHGDGQNVNEHAVYRLYSSSKTFLNLVNIDPNLRSSSATLVIYDIILRSSASQNSVKHQRIIATTSSAMCELYTELINDPISYSASSGYAEFIWE